MCIRDRVKANSTISEMRTIDKMKACSVTSILERRSRFCTKEMADLISAQPMANTTTAFKRLKRKGRSMAPKVAPVTFHAKEDIISPHCKILEVLADF